MSHTKVDTEPINIARHEPARRVCRVRCRAKRCDPRGWLAAVYTKVKARVQCAFQRAKIQPVGLGTKSINVMVAHLQANVVRHVIGATKHQQQAIIDDCRTLSLIVDSGATVHVVRSREAFTTYRLLTEQIRVSDAGGKTHTPLGIGSIMRTIKTDAGYKQIELKNCLHIPNFSVDILSVRQMRDNGCTVTLPHGNNNATITGPSGGNMKLKQIGGLDYLCVGAQSNDTDKLMISIRDPAAFAALGGYEAQPVPADEGGAKQTTDEVGAELDVEPTPEEVVNLSILPRKRYEQWLDSATKDDLLTKLAQPYETINKYRRQEMRLKVCDLGVYAPQAQTWNDRWLYWHQLLGHCNNRTISRILRQLDPTEWAKLGPVGRRWCEHCARAKSHLAPKSKTPESRPSDKAWRNMYADVAGPYKESVYRKFIYEMQFVCKETNSIKTYGMTDLKHTEQTVEAHLLWVASNHPNADEGEMKIDFERDGVYDAVKGTTCRTDSAQYYKSLKMSHVWGKYGVKHELCSGYTQHRNGVCERAHRTIRERAAALRSARRQGPEWWYISHRHAATIHDITPTEANREKYDGACPYEARTGELPSKILKKLHSYGAQCFVHDHVPCHKLSPKGREGIYIGYHEQSQSHLVWQYPRPGEGGEITQYAQTCEDAGCCNPSEPNILAPMTHQCKRRKKGNIVSTEHVKINDDLPKLVANGNVPIQWPKFKPFHEEDEDYEELDIDQGEHEPDTIDLDYWYGNPVANWSTETPYKDASKAGVTEAADCIPTHSAKVCSIHTTTPTPAVFAIGGVLPRWSLARQSEHADMFAAAKDAEWQQMKDLNVMEKIRIADVPKGETLFTSIMNFVMKTDKHGSPLKAKARLCFGGHRMIKGVHYEESASLTPRWSTIRAHMANAVMKGRRLKQSDIPGAFLLGPPQKVMFMRAPNDQVEYDEHGQPYVYRVIGNTYGTKTGGKVFQDCLREWLTEMDFERAKNDPCLFTRGMGTDDEIQLVTWCDDLAYHGATDQTIDEFETQLQAKWGKHKDMVFEEMEFFLGANVEQSDGRLHMHHKVLIEQALGKFFPGTGKDALHPKRTPFPPGAQVNKSDCPKPGEKALDAPYRELVGVLQYLAAVSRCDIAFCASQLATVQANPGTAHWKLAKHCLSYLAGTKEYGPTYTSAKTGINADEPESDNYDLTYYCDASYADVKPFDFAIDDDGRRSQFGYIGLMAGGPVSWASRLHKGRRCLSSTESELIAACVCSKDILHMRWVTEEMGIRHKAPTVMYEDNQSCIYMLLKEGISERTKHIEVKWFFTRDCINEGLIHVKKVHTSEQRSDGLTKSLPHEGHHRHASELVGQTLEVNCIECITSDTMFIKTACYVHVASDT